MTNVIPFPASGASEAYDAAAEFLSAPEPHAHGVQFYDSDAFLVATVTAFLAAGLKAGDRLVVIATEAHREALTHRLESLDLRRAVAAGQVVLLDARATLSKFMVGDMPDPDLFRDLIGRVIAPMHQAEPRARIRAYGEMVDQLWKDGNSRAAIRLEELWNEVGKTHAFSLLCAYVMGNFYREGDGARFMEICRNHTHVIPTEAVTGLDDPRARLREISLLQQRARMLESEIQHRTELEAALRDALRERSRVEVELRAGVKREVVHRERAEASDAFKDMFLGILAHDLRNPLNTVLTTARLMQMRAELAAESVPRMARIVSSGVRMERLIDQLLDVARARLAGGIPVTLSQEHDLVPLVGTIVDELQVAHPERQIVLETAGACPVRVDADRFEQLISNLLGNAVTHGAPARPITVAVRSRQGVATASVHNFGAPIDPALVPTLFDPFRRGVRRDGNGLGLGLYIAERIVSAHGGKIEVDSSVEAGTRFEAVFPVSPMSMHG
jgi:signal transduction histidine kinase